MDTETAYREFRIRRYPWALREFQREIDQGYPYLRTIAERDVQTWIVLLEGLDNEQKRIVSRLLVKRRFQKTIESTENPFTAQDLATLKQYLRVLPMLPRKTPDPSQGDIKPIKMRRLASRIIERISPILGDQRTHFSEMEWSYVTPVGDWNVTTEITIYNPREPEVRYWHSVSRNDDKTPPRDYIYDFVNNLGLGVAIWRVDYGYELEPTADSLAALCAHFIDAFPRLVEGLSIND